MSKMIKSISVTDYYYECGDGCCSYTGYSGVIIDQDGNEHKFDTPNLQTAIEEFLGDNFALTYDHNFNED